MSLRVDLPATSLLDDRLHRQDLIDRLVDILIEGRGSSRRATRVVAGLTGAWGSGKSSVMGRLSERLSSMANVIVVNYNPWIVGHGEENLRSFLGAVEKSITASVIDDAKSISDAFDTYREALEPIVKDTSTIGRNLVGFIPKKRVPSLSEAKRTLERTLIKLESAVVVLIDELDRVDDQDVREMARTVKAIGDLPNISYLIAFDRKRVEQALGSSGSDYIKKLVQFSISIRPLMDYEALSLLTEQLCDRGYNDRLGDKDLFEAMIYATLPVLRNPRDIKRIVSGFAAIEPAIRDEVNPVDIFAYSVLSAVSPSFRDFLEVNSEHVVNDPIGVDEYRRRANKKRDELSEEAFNALGDESLIPLVKFMFPFLANADRDEQRFGRVQDRKNLLALLYLGDPPFRLSRKQMLDIGQEPTANKLKELDEKGLFEDFIWQQVRVFHELPAKLERASWKAVAAYLGTHAVLSAGNARDYLHAATSSIVQIGQKDPDRAIRIFQALRASKDLVIAPSILRYHMFSHGLVKGQSPRGGPTLFDLQTTKRLLTEETDRYQVAISKRAWTSKGASPDLFYSMEQSGRFRPLRNKFAVQLRSKPAAILFGLIMTPPGTAYEEGALLKFVDVPKVLPHLKKMLAPQDSAAAASLENLIDRLTRDDLALRPEH